MVKSKRLVDKKIKFKKGLNIGSAAAEDDEAFLDHCFVDTEDLDLLKDLESPKSIVVGRTGEGKSALLIQLETQKKSIIRINPSNLSLSYICNSDIIQFLTEMGVDLDIFYQMLWRHVLSIELLKTHFKITNRQAINNLHLWLSKARPKRKIAVDYLEKWETTFWLESDERVKEIVSNFEKDIKAKAGIAVEEMELSASTGKVISEETKTEIMQRSKKVVHDVQIKNLGEVINLIGEDIYNNPKQPQFIVIDDLDTNWVEDTVRYKLIRALIETVKTFRNIPAVKILIAMRSDLLDSVYKKTLSTGFQPEKYKDFELKVNWSQEKLKELVDKRISLAMQRAYTKESVKFEDVFPEKINDKPAFSYLIERTLKRPRDIIKFINTILDTSQGKTEITQKLVLDAESVYSSERKESLIFEWMSENPLLEDCLKVLEKKTSKFPLGSFDQNEIDHLVLQLYEKDPHGNDPIGKAAKLFFNGKITKMDFLSELICEFYKMGVVGIKAKSFEKPLFCFESVITINSSLLDEDTTIIITPMLWRCLGVHKSRKGINIDPNQQAA